MRVLLLACLSVGACILVEDPGQGEHGSTGEEEAGSSAGSWGEAADGSSDGGEAEAERCEPLPDSSCAETFAPAVRTLESGERLAISTRNGTEDLVFGPESLTRVVPPPQHPGYLSVFWWWRPQIVAPLSAATIEQLDELMAALPAAPGPRSDRSDATIRFGDVQSCFPVGNGCGAFDDLHAFATDVDARLLQAWQAGDSGALYVIEEIEPAPWPLDLDWGDGGQIEISQQDWESLDTSWFSDPDDRLAHVGRRCTGGDDGCNVWTVDISILQVAESPLDDEDHRGILATLGGWLYPLGPFSVQAPAFVTVRDAHVLRLHDPDAPQTSHLITTVALAGLNLDDAL